MNDNLTKNVEFNEQQVTQLQTNISEEEFNFLNRVLSKYRIADEHISELTDEHINGVVDKIKERVSEMKKKMELNPEEHTYKDLKWFQPSDETIRNIIKNYGEFCYELDLFGQGHKHSPSTSDKPSAYLFHFLKGQSNIKGLDYTIDTLEETALLHFLIPLVQNLIYPRDSLPEGSPSAY